MEPGRAGARDFSSSNERFETSAVTTLAGKGCARHAEKDVVHFNSSPFDKPLFRRPRCPYLLAASLVTLRGKLTERVPVRSGAKFDESLRLERIQGTSEIIEFRKRAASMRTRDKTIINYRGTVAGEV